MARGPLPYGYIKDGDSLKVPDPHACYILEVMRLLKITGQSYSEIASYLNASGFRTLKGLEWNLWSVRQMFQRNRFVVINSPRHLFKWKSPEHLYSTLVGVEKDKSRSRGFKNWLKARLALATLGREDLNGLLSESNRLRGVHNLRIKWKVPLEGDDLVTAIEIDEALNEESPFQKLK